MLLDDGAVCGSVPLLWDTAAHLGIADQTSLAERPIPLPRLWQPDTMVQETLLPLLLQQIVGDGIFSKTKDIQVWDLGCGAGRDICFLGEEVLRWSLSTISTIAASKTTMENNLMKTSVHFVGWDIHKGSAKRFLPLWQQRVDSIKRNDRDKDRLVLLSSEARCEDLRKLNKFKHALIMLRKVNQDKNEDEETYPYQSPSLRSTKYMTMCYAVRFLNRSLFQFIALGCPYKSTKHVSEGPLKKNDTNTFLQEADANDQYSSVTSFHYFFPAGGVFAVASFCRATPGGNWPHDHPNSNHVLDRFELRDMFIKGWEILRDEIYSDGDHGRTLVRFVARKLEYTV
mmetsp:Transcript_8235/g.17886  ORF Transcript_8235/g.17886 Transcript_8235/m.17886 type:complete len:342 (+) Transcript_8235:3510-4535(+)